MTDTSPRIRPAAIADAAAVAALAAEFRIEHGDPSDYLTAEAIRRDGFGPRPEFAILVAERRETLVGYALFYDVYEPAFAARGVYLADLYVAPQARRRGLGRRLVAAVAADARARDREFVWWVAQARNGDAQRLYRRFATVEVPLVGFAVTLDGFQAMAADGAADSHAADDGPK